MLIQLLSEVGKIKILKRDTLLLIAGCIIIGFFAIMIGIGAILGFISDTEDKLRIEEKEEIVKVKEIHKFSSSISIYCNSSVRDPVTINSGSDAFDKANQIEKDDLVRLFWKEDYMEHWYVYNLQIL